jgi:hypothetical protein
VDEQRASRVKKIRFVADLNVIKCANQIHHATRIHVQPQAAQDSPKQNQIM